MSSLRLATLVVILAALDHHFEAVEAKTRKMTVANSCSYTIWPAIFTSVGPPPTKTPTGWEAPPGTSWTFEVEEGWGGRIWSRTDCDFSDSSKEGSLQCATGACNGGLECDPSTGTGVPPCSLAEFNLQENIDHYDSSNVDGFSIPMAITSNGDCPLSNCPYDLLPTCPDKLQKKDASGKVVGCLTDCGANPQNQEYCCFGAHDTLATCPLSGIPNYDFWLKSCPISYIYAYGDALALFTCTKRVDWTVTFCPGPESFDTKVTYPDGKTTTQGSGLPAPTAVSITRTGVTAGGGGSGPTSKGKTSAATKSGVSPAASTTTPAAETGATSPPAAGTSGASSASSSTAAAGDDGSATSDSGSASDAGAPAVSAGSGASNGSDTMGNTSDSDSDEDQIMGFPSTYVYAVAGAIGAPVVVAVAFLLVRKRSHRHKHAPLSGDERSTTSAGSVSDSEDGHGSYKSRKKRRSDSETDDDDGTTARSLGALAAMEKAEHLAARESVYAAAAKDQDGLSGLIKRDGEYGYLPNRLFALSKQGGAAYHDSSSSDDARRQGAGRPYGEALI